MGENDFLRAAEIKAEIRKAMRHERKMLNDAERNTASWQVANYLRGLVAQYRPEIVALYLPMKEEIDLRQLARDLSRDLGVELALPRVAAKGSPLVFNKWAVDAEVDYDKLGMNCAAGEEVIPNMVVMPCLAFDKKGYRIGYGGGYYDMTMRSFDRPCVTITVGYSVQEVERIEAEYHDFPTDYVVTEKGVFSCL